ncbi:hypothetical protein [Streptomyces erythrochromogenes]|uniref:hypothetical protein n=1 Tax=Streptomyces erythrochromogenes TaxID=285574 RepID=UPI00369B7DEA
MTVIEPGLYVRNGFAEGPLADDGLSRAACAAQLLHDLQEGAPRLTDGQLREGVYRTLRHYTREQPPVCQVDSYTALIRRGVRIDWLVRGRLPCARRSGLSRRAGEAGPSGAVGLPLSVAAGRLAG